MLIVAMPHQRCELIDSYIEIYAEDIDDDDDVKQRCASAAFSWHCVIDIAGSVRCCWVRTMLLTKPTNR